MRRTLAISLLLVIGTLVAALGSPAASPPRQRIHIGPTYELGRFKITYPYEGDRSWARDDEHASVSYGASWIGDTYPGTARCRIILLDHKGLRVGYHRFEFSGLSPGPRRASTVPIKVRDVPVRAEGKCGNRGIRL
jgi:hypothetical protein